VGKSKFFEKTLSTKRIYDGRIVSLREEKVELPNGKSSLREVVEHPGAVTIVALTDKSEIVLVRQFRKPAEQELLEIPAGLVHKGEKPRDAAVRELEEETGYKAGKISEVISAFSSPGYSSEVIRYFLAKDLTKTSKNTDHDEFTSVELVPISKAFDLVRGGKIRDNKTIVGITIAEKWKNT
jgi:ADP-ribose pyrophosphatase